MILARSWSCLSGISRAFGSPNENESSVSMKSTRCPSRCSAATVRWLILVQ
ncbi:hypothetical protein HMPREF9577_01602 [Cutibacterium acnes HL110PA3]|nr:hypothetical protein HMPREF9577_01602 [Cutibacterium acnes HL110PA3]